MALVFETTTVGWLTIIVGWILTVLALIAVALYIWSKYANRRSFRGADDILLYLSLFLSLALMAVTTWAVVVEGQGKHQPAESRSQFELVAKSLLVNEVLWGIVNTLMRIGAILFIRRVFIPRMRDTPDVHWYSYKLSDFDRVMDVGTRVLMSLSIAYGVGVFVTSLAICQPISASWDPTTPAGSCGNEIVAYLSLEIIAAILDLAITIAPLPRIARLKIPSQKRLTVLFLFSLGSVVFIITGLRVAALNRVNSRDFSYDRGYIGFLSILGPLIAIICGCTTASASLVYRTIRNWAKNNGFSSTMEVWSRGLSRRRTAPAASGVSPPSRPGSSVGTPQVVQHHHISLSGSTLHVSETRGDADSIILVEEQAESVTGSRRGPSSELPTQTANWV
ncbi:hypothetical protein F5Y17DRAFT_436238 [Xylariaceae sp. FL0594]|nr:hypothetical protein F5Y17DRAFT_436238 [Xylariaceae sp. FL0594]